MHGSIECTIIIATYYFFDSTQGGLEVPCTDLYTVLFIVMQKFLYTNLVLVKILILTRFSLTRASSSVNSSNLILCQILSLYGMTWFNNYHCAVGCKITGVCYLCRCQVFEVPNNHIKCPNIEKLSQSGSPVKYFNIPVQFSE